MELIPITPELLTNLEQDENADLLIPLGQEVLGWYPAGINLPWSGYFARIGNSFVGKCAFKTAPDAAQEVEVAYCVLPEFEGRGIATLMVSELMDLAARAQVKRMIAYTKPENGAASRVLVKSGFKRVDSEPVSNQPLWRWEFALSV